MIQYPLILIDKTWTKENQMVIVIPRPILSYEPDRLLGNQELIDKQFCNCGGRIHTLTGIEKISRNWSLLMWFLNGFKFNVFVRHRFKKTNKTLSLYELKQITTQLMTYEIAKKAQIEHASQIADCSSYKEVIDQFYLGLQG